MCGQPFSLLLCSGGIEVTFKQLFQRRNLLKFGVVLPKYLLIFIIHPITFVLIKQLHGLWIELVVVYVCIFPCLLFLFFLLLCSLLNCFLFSSSFFILFLFVIWRTVSVSKSNSSFKVSCFFSFILFSLSFSFFFLSFSSIIVLF